MCSFVRKISFYKTQIRRESFPLFCRGESAFCSIRRKCLLRKRGFAGISFGHKKFAIYYFSKRVLLKISGEALAGDKHFGLDFAVIGKVCDVIKEAVAMGVQVGVVVGGGNFWRGVKDGSGRMERTRADHMGMMATVMNALALADVLEQKDVPVRVQTAVEMRAMAEPYIRSRAIRHLEKGRVVIFGCGTGNPFFSTDTAAVLRAAEINADVILLAKNVDGVYSADPNKDPDAVKYDSITYDDVLAQHLAVMDSTATSLSMDNHIPVLLFALKDPYNIIRVLRGEQIGTIVKED